MLWHSVQLIVIVLFNSFGPKYPIFNSVDDLVGLQHVHTSQMKKKKKRNIKSYSCVQFTHCHRCMASKKKKRGWCSNKYKSESHKNVRLGAAGVRSLAERKDCGVVLLAWWLHVRIAYGRNSPNDVQISCTIILVEWAFIILKFTQLFARGYNGLSSFGSRNLPSYFAT